MNVILRSDVKGLGKRGDVVSVSDGHARNFLLPHGLAIGASEGAVAQAAAMRKARDNKERASREAASPSPRVSVRPPSRCRQRPATKVACSARSPRQKLPRQSPRKPVSKSTSATSRLTRRSAPSVATRLWSDCSTTSRAPSRSMSRPAELPTAIHRLHTGLSTRPAPSDPQDR